MIRHACTLTMVAACWSSQLLAQATWVLNPAGGPSARRDHAATYDHLRGRLVLFGGTDGGAVFGDTWEFDGFTWVSMTPASSPSPRCGHGMAYDLARGKVVLFGGNPHPNWFPASFDDTWEWDGTNWARLLSPHSPTARVGMNMCTNVDGSTLLFGGTNHPQTYFGDTWRWDGTDWVQLLPANAPPARAEGDMTLDMSRIEVLLFGGENTSLGGFADTWIWNGSSWTQRPVAGPTARFRCRLASDYVRGVIVLHGGTTFFAASPETWEWNGITWSNVTVPNAPPRFAHAMVFDSRVLRTTLCGGVDSLDFSADVWTLGVPVAGSSVAFGAGCPGSTGSPVLTTSGQPRIGSSYSLRAASLPGIALFVTGLSNVISGATPLPMDLQPFGMPGCQLLVSADRWAAATPASGIASAQVSVPFNPLITHFVVHHQVFTLDPAANLTGVVVSNAVSATIGRP